MGCWQITGWIWFRKGKVSYYWLLFYFFVVWVFLSTNQAKHRWYFEHRQHSAFLLTQYSTRIMYYFQHQRTITGIILENSKMKTVFTSINKTMATKNVLCKYLCIQRCPEFTGHSTTAYTKCLPFLYLAKYTFVMTLFSYLKIILAIQSPSLSCYTPLHHFFKALAYAPLMMLFYPPPNLTL